MPTNLLRAPRVLDPALTTGVPQDSIFGPLLFILYINEFSQASNMFNFVMYADDTTLTSTVSNFRNNSNPVETSINAELLKNK